MLRRVDPASAARIQPRDLKRIVRALEVFFLTGRPLTAHFADTRVADCRTSTCWRSALRLPAAQISERVARRVDEQFARGLLDEIRALLARGVPETARPFGGLVYRQALEHLHGVRDEAATRALIAQENRRYARRQLIWFRKEPNLHWLDGPGESPATIAAAEPAARRTAANDPVTDSRLAEPRSTRAIVIVLDSVGIGELPDADHYGDEGSDTLGNIARRCRCSVPTLRSARSGARRGHRRTRRRRRRSARRSAAWPKRRPARTRSPATGR